MTAREILLKHLDEGATETMKKIHAAVNYYTFIAAMEEYATQEVEDALIGAGVIPRSSLNTEFLKAIDGIEKKLK